MDKNFKLCDKCNKCAKYKKDCKGYGFSVNIESFYCPKFKQKGEK